MVNNELIEEEEKLKMSITDLVGDEDMETELWRDCPDERRISTAFKASLQRPSVLREISVFEMKIIDDDDSEDGELKSSSEEAHLMASQPQDPPLQENSPTKQPTQTTKVQRGSFTNTNESNVRRSLIADAT